jgi:hypothetical protein
MGVSHGEFTKYPRTPHLFGSRGTDDDRHLDRDASERFLDDKSLIVEEKLDGTNVGIHFTTAGELILQCRGHLIRPGMHPQYDLFKQWATVSRHRFEERLTDRYLLFGEWLYAKHSIFYRGLTHYFFEFDIFDKVAGHFLDLAQRELVLDGSGIFTVPIVHRGPVDSDDVEGCIGPSAFDSQFENPTTGQVDGLMEGLYLRTEADGRVSGRAKYVRPEFTEKPTHAP